MARSFETTSWTVVLAAQEEDSQGPREALGQLCQTYWPPLYAYFRGKGATVEEAQDLTQELFACLVNRDFLGGIEKGRGKFRSYLLASANNFLKDEWRRSGRRKRGGETPPVAIELCRAERLYASERARHQDPRALFERHWAEALLGAAVDCLGEEYAVAGRSRVFEALKGALVGDGGGGTYRVLGEPLGMSEGAVKTTIHRMRKRYCVLLRAEIARTVSSPEQVEEELRYLLEVVGR